MNLTSLALLVQDATAPAGGGATAPKAPGFFELGGMFWPLILCFGVFWLLVLRPEQKQRKKRTQMLAELKKGDRVMTTGGMYGTIVQVQDQIVTLQVAEGVRMRFALSAVQGLEDASTSSTTDKPVEAKT